MSIIAKNFIFVYLIISSQILLASPMQLRQELWQAKKRKYGCHKFDLKLEASQRALAIKQITLKNSQRHLEHQLKTLHKLHQDTIVYAPLSRFVQPRGSQVSITNTLSQIAQQLRHKLDMGDLIYFSSSDINRLIEIFLRVVDARIEYLEEEMNQILQNYKRDWRLLGFDEEALAVKMIVITEELIRIHQQAINYSRYFEKRIDTFCQQK